MKEYIITIARKQEFKLRIFADSLAEAEYEAAQTNLNSNTKWLTVGTYIDEDADRRDNEETE